MPNVKVVLPYNLMRKLEKLTDNIEDYCDESIKKGAEYIEPKLKSKMKSTIGSGTSYPSTVTGELIGSVGISPVKKTRQGGIDVKVGMADPRRSPPTNRRKEWAEHQKTHGKAGKTLRAVGRRSYSQVTNAMIANVIEYGQRYYTQPAKPMLRPVQVAHMPTVLQIISDELDKKVGDV